jgi:MFS family permease
MFLLPSLLLGLVFAALLGGRLERLLEIRLRGSWLVFAALGSQVAIFSLFSLSSGVRNALHLLSYALLIAFAIVNARFKSLLVFTTGMLMNAAAIAANGGRMPVAGDAADAAQLQLHGASNVQVVHGHLWFLGDVFALPHAIPLTNVFSVGDVFIAIGMIVFVVYATLPPGRGDLHPSRILAPLHNSSYRRLASAKLISTMGDWLTMAALVGWIYDRTHSTTAVAVLMLVRIAPPVLGGGVAAVIVDRLAKDRLLVWVEVLRGCTAVVALAGVLVHQMWVVLLAIAVSGLLSATGRTAVPALIPTMLPKEQLASANASLGVAEDVAMAFGAVLAGVSLSWFGTAPALAADAASFAIAAVLFSKMRIRAVPPRARGDARENGLRYLMQRRRLLLLVCSFAAATLATGLISVTLPRFLGDTIGFDQSGYGYGFGALALGLAAGQALVGFSQVGDRAGRWIGLGLATMGGLFVIAGMTAHAPTVLLLLAAAGIVDGTTDVVFKTVIQRDADPRYYGAVFGFAGAAMRTTMMLGVAAGPVANQLLEPRHVILVAGLALGASSAIALAIGGPALVRPKARPAAASA